MFVLVAMKEFMRACNFANCVHSLESESSRSVLDVKGRGRFDSHKQCKTLHSGIVEHNSVAIFGYQSHNGMCVRWGEKILYP